MGLVRATIITFLCYFATEKLWDNEMNPFPKNKKCEYEKYIILALIFILESFW